MRIYELSDRRFLGIEMFEIVSLPVLPLALQEQKDYIEKTYKAFVNVVSETHKIAGHNTCIELLWITENVKNQTFTSKLHIFMVIRRIDIERNSVQTVLRNISDNLMNSISALKYGVDRSEAVSTSLYQLLDNVDDSCLYSVTKSERCNANLNSLYPYYFTDIIPNGNYENFNAFISTMCQQSSCCVSFQLFPVDMTPDELFTINEVSAELGRIVKGTVLNYQMYQDVSAAEPQKVYSYYSERRNSPFYMYNILVFGGKSSCATMATKIISLLQSGEDKVVTSDFMCLDLSTENISLSKQFPYYVWNVNNRLLYHYRNNQILNSIPLAKRLFRLPYVISAEEAASFFRLPMFEKSMTSLKSNQAAQSQEQFSQAVVGDDNIKFGKLASNDGANITIGCPEQVFTKHALIVGTPGSGKTTFAVNILLQFAKRGIPFLAIEPTKSEYRAMIDSIPDLQIFTPGNNSVSPFIINPFIPPRGIRIEQYIPSLASAFKAAFSMPSPLDMFFLRAIRAAYIQYGWKDYSQVGDPDVILFGLREFILVFKRLMDTTNYSKDVRGNIESAGILRLTNLIEQNSNIYDTVNTVPIEDLLTAPTVLELNSIDNAEQKSLIMALLLINVCLYTKHNQIGDGKLKNVILIDEAHVLLGGGSATAGEGQADSQGATIKALQDMIAEIRSYGTSIIIADQSPTKVSREVVANTDIKVAFRLVQSAEKSLIADSTNMDDDAQQNLSKLAAGAAYVYFSKLDAPQMVLTEDIREKEGIRLSVPDAEVATRSTYWGGHAELLKPYSECQLCQFCKETCDFTVRANADYLANAALNRYRSVLKDKENLKKVLYHLPSLLVKEFEQYAGQEIERLYICARIKLYRKATLELPVDISEKDKEAVLTRFPKVPKIDETDE